MRIAHRLRGIFGPRSLQRRLLLAALSLVIVALVIAGLSIGFILNRFVRGQIDGRLDDRVQALADRKWESGPDAPPFDRPRSGWYWQVRQGERVLRSTSLDGRDLVLTGTEFEARRDDRPRPADGTGPWGEALILRVLVEPGVRGEAPVVIAVSAPRAALRGPVREALQALVLSLGLLGLFLSAGAVAQVRLGLRPLARLRQELAAVRKGRLTHLPTDQPAEVAALVREINALLDQNAANLAHARAHVANLAHGLKTPLATLSMAVADRDADRDGALARLVADMDRRVRHHLRRARVAAVAGPSRTRAPLAPTVNDLVAVLARLHADKGLAIETAVPSGLTVACDGQDLDEMLGNLVENACRWCSKTVGISAVAEDGHIRITIADDGPGLTEGEAADVLARGRRLDESLPGHGFGLPIAQELAELYGGRLVLERADLGGLAVRLILPA